MPWYYARNGQSYGPVEEPELRGLAQRGELTPDDLVWNPAMGREWARAASVAALFAAPPSAPGAAAVADGVGGTHNRDLMRMARDSLSGYWGLGVGVMLLYLAVTIGAGMIPFVGSIVNLVLAGPLAVGLYLVFLALARRQPAGVDQLFRGFKRFGTALGAYLLMNLFILLWSLLLIVPGIVASFAYAMTFYVLADDPTVGPRDAIARSKAMMRGHKGKLFCLYWRFFGWALLCLLTCGVGFLWLGPYLQTTVAHFYDDVRPPR